jgi:hypothetical protein
VPPKTLRRHDRDELQDSFSHLPAITAAAAFPPAVAAAAAPGRSAKKEMSPHYWIEFRSVKKIALFVCLVGLVAIFWFVLPADAKEVVMRPRRRGIWSLPAMMTVGWIAGWFLLCFVRAEDLHVAAPFNFEALNRVIALALIGAAIAIGGFLSVSFFA